MNIVTLTLSPAFDIHCDAESITVNHENIASITDYNAGGKGVNISRALRAYGTDSTAIVALGEENGDNFAASLKRDGIVYREIKVKGRIRENITVHTADGKETRLSFTESSAPADLITRVQKITDEICGTDTVLTMTGRAPEGVSAEEVKGFLVRLKSRGVKVVVDSRSFTLSDLVESKPFLIKPNEEEIAAYMGRKIKTKADALLAARELYGKGIENVMISLGGEGAVMVSDSGEYSVSAPKISAVSTIGAGDSAIAGFLVAVSEGKADVERLKYAVAFGSAACLTSGTRPPKREDIIKFLRD